MMMMQNGDDNFERRKYAVFVLATKKKPKKTKKNYT